MLAHALAPIDSRPRAEIARLFDEEAALWARDLLWNFGPTRSRLESALDDRSLRGFVLADSQGACAYATYATDGDHGIVGSCFTAERSRGAGIEAVLARRVLEQLLAERPTVIDCQTLFSSEPSLVEPFASRGFTSAPRIYMVLDRATWLAERRSKAPLSRSRPVHRGDLRALARLIYDAHDASRRLDASSSFDTLSSCERILRQIVIDEVCGPFDTVASRRLEGDGRVVAASLLTWPLPGVAHVSEVATLPAYRRRGLARRCLTETLDEAFERGRATAATLSVTASNGAALAL